MLRRIAPLVALLALLMFASQATAEDKFFDSNGVKIHYIVEGEGEPVVLVHGFTANIQTQWGLPGIINKLKKDYQVIALDNRGHGKSDKPHDPKEYGAEMVNDVTRLMDHLKLEKAHVVGYSMGGFMTNYLLNTHPERLITATLGGAGWSKSNDDAVRVHRRAGRIARTGKGIGPLIDRLTPEGQPKPDKQQLEFINQMVMMNNDPKALAACIRGMRGLAVTEAQLKANKVPTLRAHRRARSVEDRRRRVGHGHARPESRSDRRHRSHDRLRRAEVHRRAERVLVDQLQDPGSGRRRWRREVTGFWILDFGEE